MNKFRQLKEYSNLGKNNVTILSLMDTACIYWYDGKIYKPTGIYHSEYDFLLEYYVKGINPRYMIDSFDRIVPYLYITLSKDGE